MSLIEKGKRITDQDKWCRREFAYKLLQLGFVVVPTLNKQVIFVQVVGNIASTPTIGTLLTPLIIASALN